MNKHRLQPVFYVFSFSFYLIFVRTKLRVWYSVGSLKIKSAFLLLIFFFKETITFFSHGIKKKYFFLGI